MSLPKHLPADERRAATVESVVQLAGVQNPSEITTAAIAKHMQVTQGALFRHFPSKEAIWQAVMEWVAENLLARIDRAIQTLDSPLAAMEAMFMSHIGHALARRRRVRLAEVLDHEFVGTHPGSAINAALARGAAEAGRPLKLRMQVTGFDALCLMVAAGLGLGVMPRGSALIYRSALGLRTLTLAEPWAQRRLMLCVRAQGELPGVARHLVAHLQD